MICVDVTSKTVNCIKFKLMRVKARVYDCLTFRNCTFSYVLALDKKDGSGKFKRFASLKYKIGTKASVCRWSPIQVLTPPDCALPRNFRAGLPPLAVLVLKSFH